MIKTYFIQEEETKRIKIGKSNDPQKRLKQLQTGNSQSLKIVAILDGDIELEFHEFFQDIRIRGEWFKRLSKNFSKRKIQGTLLNQLSTDRQIEIYNACWKTKRNKTSYKFLGWVYGVAPRALKGIAENRFKVIPEEKFKIQLSEWLTKNKPHLKINQNDTPPHSERNARVSDTVQLPKVNAAVCRLIWSK